MTLEIKRARQSSHTYSSNSIGRGAGGVQVCSASGPTGAPGANCERAPLTVTADAAVRHGDRIDARGGDWPGP